MITFSRMATQGLPTLSVKMLVLQEHVKPARPRLLAVLGFVAVGVSSAAQPGLCAVDSSDEEMEPAPPGYIVSDAMRKKYGRYPPWCRLNVDQVPLPFVNDMDKTYEERGATRVLINQGGPSLSKRQATGQICFRPAIPPRQGCTDSEACELYDKYIQAQPAPCIIFRGQGFISEAELNAYPDELVVLWQAKAWVDRPIAKEWVEDVMQPFIEAERKAGVASETTRYMLFQDNLDSQKQPDYLNLLNDLCIDDHKVPPNETDQVQPVDRGLGAQVKLYMGQAMDDWLDDDANLAKWEDSHGLSASDRRILLANWYTKAVKRALEGEAKWKYFQHAGALITADGTDDDLIKLEGTPAGYKIKIPSL